MKYALGNMLNGAGGLNADQLALDLQFATDKTLTARKGPTPVLTRGSTGTFVGSNGLIQSAGNNVARFDHDPVTLASRGLLIEEGRTNLFRGSVGLTTGWNLYNGATRTPNSTTAPDGSNSASLISFSALSNSAIEQELLSQPAGTYTYSLYMRADSPTTVRIGNGSPTVVCSVTTAWQRFTLTFITASTGTLFLHIYNSASGGARSFYAWGAQVESGSFPTSYIPTTTSALARSADICSITGSDFTSFYNQSEGTIVGSGLTNSPTTNAGPELFRSNDGTSNNRIQLGMTNFPGQAVRPFIVASGTATYSSTQGTATVGVERKVGMAYKTNDAISAFNGTLGTLDTTVTPPTNCNQVNLFAGLGAGTISAIRYYKKRLPDAKLITLTT
jgi:hypothetical protein